MWLKLLVIVLVILMLISLSGALVTLFKDADDETRTVRILTIRVILAILIIALLTYGYFSGDLVVKAPWAGRY
jgi:hypothetical protein